MGTGSLRSQGKTGRNEQEVEAVAYQRCIADNRAPVPRSPRTRCGWTRGVRGIVKGILLIPLSANFCAENALKPVALKARAISKAHLLLERRKWCGAPFLFLRRNDDFLERPSGSSVILEPPCLVVSAQKRTPCLAGGLAAGIDGRGSICFGPFSQFLRRNAGRCVESSATRSPQAVSAQKRDRPTLRRTRGARDGLDILFVVQALPLKRAQASSLRTRKRIPGSRAVPTL